jgi:hypothetical protein
MNNSKQNIIEVCKNYLFYVIKFLVVFKPDRLFFCH